MLGSDMAELSERVRQSIAHQEQYLTHYSQILRQAGVSLAAALARGNKLITFGCPPVAQHLVAEFTGRFTTHRPGLAAVCLCDNPSAITAIANDYGREAVYPRQIQALSQSGDFVLAFTAGGDPAARAGIDEAHKLGLETLVLEVPGADENTALETSLTAGHLLCEQVEFELRRIRPEWFDQRSVVHPILSPSLPASR
jgi:phosphoheptose isomerase